MKRTLLIAPFEKAEMLAVSAQNQSFDWFYFGTNASQREQLTRQLGESSRVDFGEELNRLARELKQPFLDWLVRLGEFQNNKVNWWCSRLASKSPLQNDVFLLICYTQLVAEWVGQESTAQPIRLIIAEDPWIYNLLKENLSDNLPIRFLPLSSVSLPLRELRTTLKGFLSHIRFCINTGILLFLSRLLLIGRKPDFSRRSVLLFSWIEERCFDQKGRFRDWYTVRLERILQARGQSVKRLSSSINFPVRQLLKIRNLTDDFIVAPRHIGSLSILKAAFSEFKIENLEKLESLKKWNYRALLLRERWREKAQSEFAGYLLWYYTAKKIAREYGKHTQCLIYTFENQPWEKLLCMAWNEEAPHTFLAGYQHSFFGSLLLGYFLGRGEKEASPLPHQILASGRLGMETLIETGFPAVKNGGALRHEHLHTAPPPRSPTGRPALQGSRVIVALPIAPVPAADLLQNLINTFQNQDNSIQFLVKCHLQLPFHIIFQKPPKLPANFTIEQRSLATLFETADLFLYVPPTTACWDAYLSGLPVLKYRGNFLDIDYAEALKDKIGVCDKTTLKEAIHNGLRVKTAVSPDSLRELLNQVFSPVDENAWISTVNSRKAGG